MLGDVGDMVQLAVMCCDRPPKALAMEIGCSVSVIYEAVKGRRFIPVKAMKKFASTNLIAAASMAVQATGLNSLFGYRQCDRHIQSMLFELRTFDKRLNPELENLQEIILNKSSRVDLNAAEIEYVCQTIAKMIERNNMNFNVIMEFDRQFNLDIAEIEQKKKPQVLAHSRLQN